MFGGVVSLLLAANPSPERTGGLRRRQGAAVPIGTKKMFGLIGQGMGALSKYFTYQVIPLQHRYDLCRTGLETPPTDRIDHCLKRRSRGS